MAVTHTKSLTGPDGVNPDRAQPTDWNANHTVDLSDYAGSALPDAAIPASHSGSTHAATQAAAEATAAAANTADIATHAAIAAAHHAKYLDSEAVTAMGAKGDANALNHDRYDDAEALAAVVSTGSWTPVISFSTAGDQNIVYSSQSGTYTLIGGSVVVCRLKLVTSTFTHSTASGNLRLTGLPFTAASTYEGVGDLLLSGWTFANIVNVGFSVYPGSTFARSRACLSGSGVQLLTTAHWLTGASVVIEGTIIYSV